MWWIRSPFRSPTTSRELWTMLWNRRLVSSTSSPSASSYVRMNSGSLCKTKIKKKGTRTQQRNENSIIRTSLFTSAVTLTSERSFFVYFPCCRESLTDWVTIEAGWKFSAYASARNGHAYAFAFVSRTIVTPIEHLRVGCSGAYRMTQGSAQTVLGGMHDFRAMWPTYPQLYPQVTVKTAKMFLRTSGGTACDPSDAHHWTGNF